MNRKTSLFQQHNSNGERRYYRAPGFREQLMVELEDGDVRFLRVGEDHDDTEVRGCFREKPFAMELLRGISFSAAV